MPTLARLALLLGWGVLGTTATLYAQFLTVPLLQNMDADAYSPPRPLLTPIIVWGDFNGDTMMEPFVSGRQQTRAGGELTSGFYSGRRILLPCAPEDPCTEDDYRYELEVIPRLGYPALWLGAGAAHDMNGDGNLDLAVIGATALEAPYEPQLYVYTGTGSSPRFWEDQIFDGTYSGDLAWGDFDNDGDADLFVTGFDGTGTGRTFLLVNDGTGQFSNGQELVGVGYSTLALVDYDGDFDLDLAVAGMLPNQQFVTTLYRNDGGRYVDAGVALPGVIHGSLAWGDYDADGDPDLLIMGAGNYDVGLLTGFVALYRNDGGTFVPAGSPVLEGYFYGDAAWLDVDADGDLDVAATGGISVVQGQGGAYFLNEGAGLFRKQSIIIQVDARDEFLMPSLTLSALGWGDYNQDGAPDLWAVGQAREGPYGTFAMGIEGNARPTPPQNPTAEVTQQNVRFAWEAGADAETAAPVLTYNLRVGRTPEGGEILPALETPFWTGDRSTFQDLQMVTRPGNVGQNLGWQLTLAPGTYYWSVQACDAAHYCSRLTDPASFEVLP